MQKRDRQALPIAQDRSGNYPDFELATEHYAQSSDQVKFGADG